ncbi:MAG: PDZ domain-containing protein, partial [Pseudomonadota bacterium]
GREESHEFIAVPHPDEIGPNVADDWSCDHQGKSPGTARFHAIERSSDLPSQVGMSKPGDKVTLEVWRAGEKKTLSTTLNEAKELAMADDAGIDRASAAKLGIAVRPLTPDERNAVNLASGLVVEQSAGRGARAGIQPGDIIVSVNGVPLKSVEQLQSIVAKQGKQLALLIQRGDAKIFVPVNIG